MMSYSGVASGIWRITEGHDDNAAASISLKVIAAILIGGAWVLITGVVLLQLVYGLIEYLMDEFDI